MKDARVIDLHARKLESDGLTGAEELELFSARAAGDETGEFLRADQDLHDQLKALFRLRNTATDFAETCHARVVASRVEPDVSPVDGMVFPAVNTRAAGPVAALRRRRGAGPWRGSFAALVIAAAALAGVGAWLLWLNIRTANQPQLANRGDKPDSRLPLEPVPTAPEAHRDTASDIAVGEPALPATSGAPVETAPVLGRLSEAEDARWVRAPQPLTSYPAEFELANGTAALELVDGPTVVFQGPARLTVDSPRELSARGGTYRIQTLDGREVSFTTPEVRFEQPGDGTFFVTTGGDEGTLVDLDAGDLVAQPWSSQRAKPISLSHRGLNRGLFGPAWNVGSKTPAVAMTVGDEGAFEGVVEVAGQPLSVRSPHVMAQVVDTSRRRIEAQPAQFPSLWQEMVGQLQGASGGQGALSVNGQSQAISSPDEWLEQMERMRQQLAIPGNGNMASASSSSGFQGSLNINGVERKFASPEEFEQARRQAFGPLFADFFPLPSMSQPMLPGEDTRSSPGETALPGMQGNSMSAFSGMINNNGNIQQFTRPEDFQRAMRQFNLGRQR